MKIAVVNLITRTSLLRKKAPEVISNKDAMIVKFVKELKNKDFEVDLYISDAYLPKSEEDLGINVIYLPTLFKYIFWPSLLPFTPGLFRKLKNNYDIIICSEIFQWGTVLAVLAKVMSFKKKTKLIVWQEMARHQRFLGQFVSKIYHSVIVRYLLDRYIDLYVPRGELARKFLLSQGIRGVKISNIISHGIDSAKFYYDPKITKERYIFSPSRLVYSKGIDTLLKAFAIVVEEILDINLIIQGDGPKLIEYQQLAEELGIFHHVTFCNKRISHDEMREKYQKALVIIFASRKDNIIFSDMESIACGTPVVISTGVDSHMNFLDGKGGIVFSAEDHFMLARAIKCFLKDEKYRKEMESLAKLKAEKFSNTYLVGLFKQVINRISV